MLSAFSKTENFSSAASCLTEGIFLALFSGSIASRISRNVWDSVYCTDKVIVACSAFYMKSIWVLCARCDTNCCSCHITAWEKANLSTTTMSCSRHKIAWWPHREKNKTPISKINIVLKALYIIGTQHKELTFICYCNWKQKSDLNKHKKPLRLWIQSVLKDLLNEEWYHCSFRSSTQKVQMLKYCTKSDTFDHYFNWNRFNYSKNSSLHA